MLITWYTLYDKWVLKAQVVEILHGKQSVTMEDRYLFIIVNNMAADGLAAQGARVSADMLLT